MLLIPFNNLVLYPALRRIGYEVTALRRMTAGIAFAGMSWIVVGGMQVVLNGGNAFSIAWQILPYSLLALGEVLVSATGLEFAYSQAPLAMKGVIMAFWNLSVTIGNLWVLVVNAGVKNDRVIGFIKSSGVEITTFQMFFFAAFAFAAIWTFGLLWGVHVIKGWSGERRRLSGGLLAGLLMWLIFSGYLLYYVNTTRKPVEA